MSSLVTGSAFGFSGPDWIGSNILKDRNREDAQISFDRTAEFQERMANTAWQRGTKDMLAAGINPMLAYTQGPATSPTPSMPLPHSSLVTGGGNTSTKQLTTSQNELLQAQADKTSAEADEVRARTPSHAVKIDEMKARIEDLRASVSERTASAARQHQQSENLRAEIPRIEADTQRVLQAARELAQRTYTGAAQEQEIAQRVKANLPELERQTRVLELYLTRIATPGKELDAEVRQSFIGILGNYLKALIPFEGIIGAIPLGRSAKGSTQQPPIHKGSGDRPTIHRR